jgi:hypothetical protein
MVMSELMFFGVPCGSGGAEGALKVDVGEFECVLVRTSRSDGEVYAAHAGAHLCPELCRATWQTDPLTT